MASAVPFNDATELPMNPAPLTVAEKMPRGICPPAPTAEMVGTGGVSAMLALAVPPMPVTLTTSELEAGKEAGAV